MLNRTNLIFLILNLILISVGFLKLGNCDLQPFLQIHKSLFQIHFFSENTVNKVKYIGKVKLEN